MAIPAENRLDSDIFVRVYSYSCTSGIYLLADG